MCGGNPFGTPFGGVPIVHDIHVQFPEEVKQAWETFHAWWQEQEVEPVSRKSMPAEVAAAFEIMKEAPIPEYEGYFGKDSCYVLGVERMLTE